MELSNEMFARPMDEDDRIAAQQRSEFDQWVAPLRTVGTMVLTDKSMWAFKKRVWIYKIVDLFGIRDDSWLTIRRMNDMRFLQKFGVLEKNNWKYLQEVIDICKEKWVELYWTELLKEIGFDMKNDKVDTVTDYVPVDIESVMEEHITEEVPEWNNKAKWVTELKKVDQDLSIDMVDIDGLEYLDIADVKLIYKRVTGKWISPNRRNDKQWFIDKLKEIKKEI